MGVFIEGAKRSVRDWILRIVGWNILNKDPGRPVETDDVGGNSCWTIQNRPIVVGGEREFEFRIIDRTNVRRGFKIEQKE